MKWRLVFVVHVYANVPLKKLLDYTSANSNPIRAELNCNNYII